MTQLTPEQIKSKILEDTWTRWLERKWGALLISLSEKAITREYMRKIGVDVELDACLHERAHWYFPRKAMDKCAEELINWVDSGHSVFEITKRCERFHKENKKILKNLDKSKISDKEKLAKIEEIMTIVMTYIWITHPMEEAFTKRIKHIMKDKISEEEIDKFMGDISIPIKKTAYEKMEEAMKAGVSSDKIAKDYGWIKVRSNLSIDGFTTQEIEEQREKLTINEKDKTEIKVPKELNKFIKQVKELVWFRTFRTDVFFEFFYLSRPILSRIAKSYKLNLEDIRDYSFGDLISGNLNKYPEETTSFANYKGNFAYFNKPILPEETITDKTLKGVVAFKGKIQGRVQIVNSAHDVPKVQEGDILVATMTFPSYIMAMKKASAFVTNEGGITCHASIVAREMKKPCIVGTKIATKVLKNGMLIEVDADKGIVKIL